MEDVIAGSSLNSASHQSNFELHHLNEIFQHLVVTDFEDARRGLAHLFCLSDLRFARLADVQLVDSISKLLRHVDGSLHETFPG